LFNSRNSREKIGSRVLPRTPTHPLHFFPCFGRAAKLSFLSVAMARLATLALALAGAAGVAAAVVAAAHRPGDAVAADGAFWSAPSCQAVPIGCFNDQSAPRAVN
jgi:xylan 1,4-beta-xylosidase